MKKVTVVSSTYDPALDSAGISLRSIASRANAFLNDAVCMIDQYGHVRLTKQERMSVYEPVSKLHVVLRGEGELIIAGKTYRLSSGNMYIIAPHEMEIRSPAGMEKLYARFTFTCRGIDLLRGLGVVSCPAVDAAGMKRVFTGENVLAVKAAVLAALACFSGDIVSGVGNSRFSYYERFFAHAASHLGERTVIYDAVALYGVTVRHFSERFKTVYGVTPKGYVTACRIDRAKELLSSGGHIESIAGVLGFDDRAHFSKVFKQHAGLSPGAFASQYRNP